MNRSFGFGRVSWWHHCRTLFLSFFSFSIIKTIWRFRCIFFICSIIFRTLCRNLNPFDIGSLCLECFDLIKVIKWLLLWYTLYDILYIIDCSFLTRFLTSEDGGAFLFSGEWYSLRPWYMSTGCSLGANHFIVVAGKHFWSTFKLEPHQINCNTL